MAPDQERFTFEERVGIGATAEVLRGHDTEKNEPVAIKRLHAHLVADPLSRERFEREARLSARIQNNHVVKYIAYATDEDDRPFLVLEWLEGEDLSRRMRTGRLSTSQAISIAKQAARGLEALHEAGIVHRDIKPGNLFLAENPAAPEGFTVKLLDLGVAHESTATTSDGVALGTPFYMSPEQARGEPDLTPSSDIFSLGVMLFELLTGQKPFAGEDAFSVLAKIVLQAPPTLTEAWKEAPAPLVALVSKTLARDPKDRLSSAKHLADTLEAIEQNNTPSLDLETPPPTTPSDDDLVGVIFGRLPLSSNVARSRSLFQKVVEEHKGKVIPLLGRGVAAIFEGECADGLLRAADAALTLGMKMTGVRLSLVTGAALPQGQGLTASVIERGTKALERPRADLNEPPVRIDDATASLLEEQYAVEGAPGSLSIRGTRNPSSSNT